MNTKELELQSEKLEEKILKEIDKKNNNYPFNCVNDILKYINKLENEYEEIFGTYELSKEFKKIYIFEYGDIKENDEIIEKDKNTFIEYLKDAVYFNIIRFVSWKKWAEERRTEERRAEFNRIIKLY